MSTALTTSKPLALAKPLPLPPSPLAVRYPKPFPKWVLDLQRPIYDLAKRASVLPVPTPEQRVAVQNLRALYVEHLFQTVDRFPALAEELLRALNGLTMTTAHSSDAGTLRAEASIESFKRNLYELPVWATLRAIYLWDIGEIGFYDEPKDRYVTKWMPHGAELRRIAKRYVDDLHTRIGILDRILREKTELPKLRDPDKDVGGFKLAFGGLKI
jgi:hypothetical protein